MPIQRAKPRRLEIPALTAADLPAGSVLQVQHAWSDTKTTTNTSANSAAPVCPAQVTITPSSASNKILIMWYGSWIFGNENDAGFWLLRNGTAIGTSTQTGNNNRALIVTPSEKDTKFDVIKKITGIKFHEDDINNLPGKDADWKKTVIAHEAGHIVPSALSLPGTLLSELRADENVSRVFNHLSQGEIKNTFCTCY